MWSRRLHSLRAARRDRNAPSLTRWLLGAVAVHAAVGWSLRSLRLPDAPPPRVARPLDTMEVTVVEATAPEPAAPSPAPPSADDHRAATMMPHRGPSATPGETQHDAPGAPEDTTSEEGRPGDGAPAPGEAARPEPPGPKLSLDQLGVGGENHFLASREGQDRAGWDEKRLTQSFQQGALDDEMRRGTSRGGPLVEALRTATLRFDAPLSGHAEFLATTDALGVVVHLEPVSVSSDFARWAHVARGALTVLAKKRLRVPQGAAGLSMRVRVVSQNKLPSGHDPGTGVSVGGQTVKKPGGKDSPKVDLLKPEVRLTTMDVKNPATGDYYQFPDVQIGLTIVGVYGDPADIGSGPQRRIDTTVVEEKAL